MDFFPADRDYAMSYMSEINKCNYVQMALSAYRNSPRGNVEKRAFWVVVENCCNVNVNVNVNNPYN